MIPHIAMNLRDFISQALLDIVGAVQDAQTKTPAGTIVPSGISTKMTAVEAGISQMQTVDFEVTVRADERSGSEARLSVVSVVLGGSVKGESGKSGGHAGTLRFRIPILLPTSDRK